MGEPAQLSDLEKVFGNLVALVVSAGGLISFVMLLVGGFKFLVARGDPKAIDSARSTITWAIVGLAMIIVAWLVLLFIKELTGIDITRFEILKF